MKSIREMGKVKILPYESGLPNAGLENHHMVVADGVHHRESLGLVEQNGVKRYLTGLNEYAPEIVSIKDPEQKEAVIRDIRRTIVFLENTLGGNHEITEKDIDEYDDDGKPTGKLSPTFWAKVKTFLSQAPDQYEADGKGTRRKPTFWDKIEVECSNSEVSLDPSNPHSLILLYGIKAGGFTMVAPSLDAARQAIHPPKFYLDNPEETAVIKTELKKLRNKAGAELQRLYDKDQPKLFYISKLCAPNSLTYTKSTSNDIMYEDCDKYINGETVDKNKKQTAEKFIEYAKMDMAALRVQAIVRDATELHLLTFNTDGQLYYNKTNSPMGKGILDVVAYLANPLNIEVLKNITEEVEAEWIK